MSQIVIFGGTAEGRQAADTLKGAGQDVLVCVTSAYARSLLPEDMPCHVGAMDEAAMEAFLKEVGSERVVDATHPYAVRATENIRSACRGLGIPYERMERPISLGGWRQDVEHVPSPHEAAMALTRAKGNILLTTGSKTVKEYTALVEPDRLWVRVLPTHEALSLCREAGVESAHVIAMQGPFTRDLNAAMYDMLDIRVMVTKDSGKQGGVEEKVIPALERDIHVILIDRPGEVSYAG